MSVFDNNIDNIQQILNENVKKDIISFFNAHGNKATNASYLREIIRPRYKSDHIQVNYVRQTSSKYITYSSYDGPMKFRCSLLDIVWNKKDMMWDIVILDPQQLVVLHNVYNMPEYIRFVTRGRPKQIVFLLDNCNKNIKINYKGSAKVGIITKTETTSHCVF